MKMIDANDVKFLKELKDRLSSDEKVIMDRIITQIEQINQAYNKDMVRRVGQIMHNRQYDKLYARSKNEITNYFNAQVNKVKKALDKKDTEKAKNLYANMKGVVCGDRYIKYFNSAVSKLSQEEIDYLEEAIL